MEKQHIEEIKKTIQESIDKNVNGKINVLTEEFRDYVKEDMAWKEEYEPYLKGLANLSGGAKLVIWFAVGISSLVGAFLAVKSLWK